MRITVPFSHKKINILGRKEEKITLRKFFKTIGPGVITGGADDDPSGIATYSQTGAKYGYGFLWTALFMLPMLYTVQEMSARIGVVTGRGIASNIKIYYSKSLLYPLVVLLVIANTINLGADLGAMAAAAQLLVPVNFIILTVFFTLLILYLEIFTSYKSYAKILKWLTFSLVAYIITGLLIHQNWLEILKSSIIPSFQFNIGWLFLIVGVLGTTISPYMIFWQASEEVEEEIEKHVRPHGGISKIGSTYIGKVRLDTFVGMLFSEVITWFIFITTAATLHKQGITSIQSASQAASALAPLVNTFPFAGELTKILFALGIIGTGLLAVPIFAGSAAYAICETESIKEGLNRKFHNAPGFYIIIIVATCIGLLINFIGINPIQALVYTAVINGIIAVPLIGMLLLIANNRKIMGGYRNNVFKNIIGIATFVIMGLAAIGVIISLL